MFVFVMLGNFLFLEVHVLIDFVKICLSRLYCILFISNCHIFKESVGSIYKNIYHRELAFYSFIFFYDFLLSLVYIEKLKPIFYLNYQKLLFSLFIYLLSDEY